MLVYGDLFFLINLLVDLILLYVAGLLAGVRASAWRLILGAVAGAAYALGFLFPALAPLYSPPLRLAFPLVTVALTFSPASPGAFLRLAAWLYGGSAFLAGVAIGAASLGTRSLLMEWAGTWWSLGLAGVLVLVAAWGTLTFARRRFAMERLLLPVEVGIGSQCVSLTGFVDTGNQLRDPLTQSPVLVVEMAALSGLLPPGFGETYARAGSQSVMETAGVLSRLPGWSTRLRVLPFSTLGNRHGMMLGFRPDWVAVGDGRSRRETRNATVAIYRERLNEDVAYQALVHPSFLSQGSAA